MKITPDRLAEFHRLRKEKESTKKAADKAKQEFDQFQADLFFDMQAEGYESLKINGVQYVRKSTIYGQVQDRAAFLDYCKERALTDEFFRETEERARVNELVRGLVDSGEELPPGLGFYAKEYVSTTESK